LPPVDGSALAASHEIWEDWGEAPKDWGGGKTPKSDQLARNAQEERGMNAFEVKR
jgi:hypothetical protein